jgi:glycosyltransferase involved in cell wall biosynthesis
MKILLIGELSWSYVVGSSTQKVQKNIFEELKRSNHNVHFYELIPEDSVTRKLFGKISVSENNVITGGLFRLWLKIIEENFEIVHLLVLRNYMLFFLPLVLGKTKIVILVHDTLSIRSLIPKKLNHLIRILFIKFAHGVFVFNLSDKELLSRYRNDYKTIFIVRQGINLKLISESNSEIITSPKILFSGGLGKDYKGLKFLRSALNLVNNNYKLLIYGPNYLGETDKDYCGVLNEIQYKEVLNQSRIVVIPSIYESFSLTALEAIANGIPVILTKSCGISNYLVDGKGCYIVEYDNVEDLATKISILLKDEIIWSKMSRDSILIAKDFDWSKIIPIYTNIYGQLLNE